MTVQDSPGTNTKLMQGTNVVVMVERNRWKGTGEDAEALTQVTKMVFVSMLNKINRCRGRDMFVKEH